jgi:hypothetical protein
MRVWAMCLLVAGCNPFFDISGTEPRPLVDAQYFDAPADAPFACPPTGETPQFSQNLKQIVQNCQEVSTSTTGRIAGLCRERSAQISEGPLEGPLVPIAGFEQVAPTHIDLVRYAPEGDELFVRIWQDDSVVGRIVVVRQTASGFSIDHDVTLPAGEATDSFIRFGTPSGGPKRRMFIRNGSEPGIREIELDETGASTLVGSYTAADFGVDYFGVPGNITADGLRVVFLGSPPSSQAQPVYADRASLADRFSTARVLSGLPYNVTPFVTADCGRLYFDGLGYIFWVQRR